ncbi:MAG: ABC transporter permease [Sandaracinus sp.]|nr:ABC transporter permease [Sandaracinus sp.]MCB9611851.1 ABC transporter permease [Sandaracinus sp.]MCB9619621.1 ABC transporter permease [Sandaracinus sp.]MCB9624536.1 ABC transporter permease [Sandaracinus sp.]MCB9635029.1 ABC transporter permease [Sandaracinus sp.]
MSAPTEAVTEPTAAGTPPRRGLGARLRALTEDPNPILVKELRTILRTPLFVRFLYLSTGLVALLVVGIGGGAASGSQPPAEVGQVLFQVFFSIALAILCLVAPAHAATSLTNEREIGTYESLVLTGMDPARIVWGKFLASYAVFALVLVAFSPVVGIAFLFGGTSPWHVLLGFYGLLLALGPAVALGVALSARLRSTRVSILLALLVFVPFAGFGTGMLTAFGELSQREWGTSMEGPFWFTEALATRFFEPDTFLLLGVLPLYLTAMVVWFLLASAIAGVRPAAEDRSTPFKLWALAAVSGLVVIVFGVVTLFDRHDVPEGSVGVVAFTGFAMIQLATLFANEPPLPPRLWELRQESRGRLAKLAGLFGPGAAPTARFGALIVLLATFGPALAGGLARHYVFPTHDEHAQADAALLVIAAGYAAVGLFTLMFGTWLRIVLRSGVASRVIALSTLAGLAILPFLAAVLIDPSSLQDMDDHMPLLVRLTPISPIITAVLIVDDNEVFRTLEVLVPVAFYGMLALFFWTLVEARVRNVRKLVAEQRVLREKRAEEAAAMRPSFTPPANQEAVATLAAIASGEHGEVSELRSSQPPDASSNGTTTGESSTSEPGTSDSSTGSTDTTEPASDAPKEEPSS